MSREQLLEILKANPVAAREALAAIEDDRQEVEHAQKVAEREIREKERREELTLWLKNLGVNGIKVGEPYNRARGIMEQVGIYINDEHVGDVYSDGLKFTKEEFLNKVKKIISSNKNQIEGAESLARVRVEVDPQAKKVMDRHNMRIVGDTLILGNDREVPEVDLYNNDENARIRFAFIDDNDLKITITEKAGDIIEYIIYSGKIDLSSRSVR